ncbi:MAG: hypothetical protein M1833_006966 [Piccolia ochrophora]|nr:MAG: hypothetical protein M1833_006966 [Piccolia ochrophora]
MAPLDLPPRSLERRYGSTWRDGMSIDILIIEAWGQGFLVGGLLIMSGITVANMRRGQLLHKLILLELLLAISHGTFCFMTFKGSGWYISSTAVLLYASWVLHDVISWMKSKAFLTRWASLFYIGTVILVIPYWVVEVYANFAFNNNINDMFTKTRPFEPLFRDPWWIFTCCNLVWNIKKRYNFGFLELFRTSPRFAVMLISMVLSIIFLIMDILSNTVGFGQVTGINPYWKLSLVFKCFCDTIILDDFASALNRLREHAFRRQSIEPPLELNGTVPSGSDNVGGLRNDAAVKPSTQVYTGMEDDQKAVGKGNGKGGRLHGFKRFAGHGNEAKKERRGQRPSEDGRIHVSTDVTLVDHQR